MRFPLTLLFAVAAPAALHATPLVLDNFDSLTAGDLFGQATTGTGLTGLYIGGNNNANQTATVTSGSLAFGDLNAAGGFRVVASSNSSGFNVNIKLALSQATVGNLYASYLANFTAVGSGATNVAELRVGDASGGAGSSARFRLQADSSAGTTNSVIQPGVGADATPVATTGTLSTGVTYLIVGRYTNVGTALNAGTTAGADLFAFTLAQYQAFIANGGTDALLDSAVVGTDVAAKVSDAPVATGQLNFTNNNWVQLGFSGAAAAPETLSYDAVRFGTTLADVTTVPEPAVGGLVLAGLGLAGGVRRRA